MALPLSLCFAPCPLVALSLAARSGAASCRGHLLMAATGRLGGGWFDPRLSPPAAWCLSALCGHNEAGEAIVPPNKPSRDGVGGERG